MAEMPKWAAHEKRVLLKRGMRYRARYYGDEALAREVEGEEVDPSVLLFALRQWAHWWEIRLKQAEQGRADDDVVGRLLATIREQERRNLHLKQDVTRICKEREINIARRLARRSAAKVETQRQGWRQLKADRKASRRVERDNEEERC